MWLPRGSLECELMETKQRCVTDKTSMLGKSSHVEVSDQGSGAVDRARL